MQDPVAPRQGRSPLTPERQDLVVRYLPLARALARPLKIQWPNARDEFESAACLALVEAAESFDPQRKIKFATFARYRITGALRDLQRGLMAQNGRLRLCNLASDSEGSRSSPPQRVPIQSLCLEEEAPVGVSVDRVDSLNALLGRLPAKHEQACRLLFLAGKTQVEAAKILGYSQSRLSTLRREALELLKAASRFHADDAA